MEDENKKIEKHIGEQVPLMSNDQGSGNRNPKDKPDNGQENSNQGTSNPLKPQETQKGLKSNQVQKK